MIHYTDIQEGGGNSQTAVNTTGLQSAVDYTPVKAVTTVTRATTPAAVQPKMNWTVIIIIVLVTAFIIYIVLKK